MVEIKRILVFPCGSEVGLEIHRSLRFEKFIELFGGSSIDDHGKFVYENYIGNIPFYSESNFIQEINKVVSCHAINAIYPTMDSVVECIAKNQRHIKAIGIVPSSLTAAVCNSKLKTYQILNDTVITPKCYDSLSKIDRYPVFMKPPNSYGSRGTALVNTSVQAAAHLEKYPESLIMEYLPGPEYTIDCFTNREGQVLFAGPRLRKRVINGISVQASPYEGDCKVFEEMANMLNTLIEFRGAWFFQVRENFSSEKVLLEVSNRPAGGSSLCRNIGINLPLLTLFDRFGHNVKILRNSFHIELSRSLENKFELNLVCKKVYVDFDDCLCLGGKVNSMLVALVFDLRNKGKKIILLSRHKGDVKSRLRKLRLLEIFDTVFVIPKTHRKSDYIEQDGSILIDDSYEERFEVSERLHIPVFAVDAIECLFGIQ